MNRRDCLKIVGTAAMAGSCNGFGQPDPKSEESTGRSLRGAGKVTIRKVRAIATAPQRTRLVVVKVETSEPGLYGLGCATFNQRPLAVITAVQEYLDPFARGRDVNDIEDMWQNAYTSSYWRNGPVLNNALSGLDMALWDIKGKRAGMPVYQLLGGKSRFAVDCYAHSSGRDNKELEESVKANMERGFRHIRLQIGGYGSPHLSTDLDYREGGFGLAKDANMDAYPYLKAMPKAFEHIRNTCGDKVELLHDVHERIAPIEAVNLLKELEKYRPFFIEDPLSPEDNGYFSFLRQHTTVPIAMGELFSTARMNGPL